MILPLVSEQAATLYQPMPAVNFDVSTVEERHGLITDLWQTMLANNGCGLAANQVGYLSRVFVMFDPKDKSMLACFNPVVIQVSDELVLNDEGCLSFPGLVLHVKRPKEIRGRFTKTSGEITECDFDGVFAQCFAHECRHMDGHTFIEDVSRLQLDLAIKAAKKSGRSYDLRALHMLARKRINKPHEESTR